jgi:hypothetical protein
MSPIVAAVVMSLSSVSVIANALSLDSARIDAGDGRADTESACRHLEFAGPRHVRRQLRQGWAQLALIYAFSKPHSCC